MVVWVVVVVQVAWAPGGRRPRRATPSAAPSTTRQARPSPPVPPSASSWSARCPWCCCGSRCGCGGSGRPTRRAVRDLDTDLLALRALTRVPVRRLLAVCPDPAAAWRRDDRDTVRWLATLELADLGLRAPAAPPD
ncbi:MAG: hypothetical protein L0H64_02980 [Pseudonocardia sp.]|nr:hypothetical protein [Pseudonocardia sp.]